MKRKLLSLFTVALASVSFAQTLGLQNTNFPNASSGVSRISIVDPNTAWISAYDGTGSQTYLKDISITTNGGQTWTTKRLTSTFPTNALISDVEAVNSTTAWIVTAPHSGSATANGVWKTTDGGTTWTKKTGMFTNSYSFANIIHFWDANTGIAIGDPLNLVYEMYKTTDGGENWTRLTTAPTADTEDEYGYVGGKAIYGDHLWLTSNTGKILYSADKGLSWQAFYTPIPDFGGASSSGSISFSSPTYGLLADSNSVLWFTENSGEDWDIKETTNYFTSNIEYVPGSENTYISTGMDIESVLGVGAAYTNDGGDTWTTIDITGQRGTIGAYDCNTIWIGHFTDPTNAGGIYKINGEIPGCNLSTSDVKTKKLELKAVVNNGTLNVVSNKEIKEVLVGDLTGKTITKVNTKDVNISNLKPGVYFARVAYTDGAFGTVKFVVK